MTTWQDGRKHDAKAWERNRKCFLHYVQSTAVWECWAHDEKCPAILRGELVEAPW